MAEVADPVAGDLNRSPGRGDQPPSYSPPLPPPPPRRPDRDAQSGGRSPSPPLPPPPPLPSGAVPARLERERDRDPQRRSSPSPPPYRRRSPPYRRSPPPPKRSRRDDGGYDRRRGSPRYDYDHDDGYGRGGRGRHGYADERSHIRHTNHSSDWHDSSRGGFGDGLNAGVPREGLMLYKQFIQELEDDILPSEAERRYEEYKSEYITTQKRAYFEAHKDEEWLKNKYHPTNLVTVIERRNEHARATSKEFFDLLENGTLDLGPGFTASSSNKSDHFSEPNSEDEAEVGMKRRRYGRGSTRENDPFSDAPKAHPISSEPRRIHIDIEQVQALICKLDTEKGIKDNTLSSGDREKSEGLKSHRVPMTPIIIIKVKNDTVKGLEGVELLDTIITYIWRVHGLDYYGMSETNEPKGLRHVRADSKTFDGSDKSGPEWEKKLVSHWQQRLQGQDPLETLTAKEKIDAAAIEVIDPFVRKIRDEKYGWKYGCGAKGCTKLFHAPEFVHKHLRLKHTDLVMELTSKVRDDLYFQNYMNDQDAPGGKPVMRASAPDRMPRRRPLEGRLRDDRRVNDRYGRSGNSPSRDTNRNGERDDDGDETMHDAYGANRLSGTTPFPPDVSPPPVLMPLPGAGPLGPFVPAPPEVAMRMMREQGGPSLFDVNSGAHGRKGRFGSQSGTFFGQGAFRQDPRRMRSYHDLDAPEDEVTVIDYRSL